MISAIFNCLNCGTIFCAPRWCFDPINQWFQVCPNLDCMAVDLEWAEMLEVEIISEFHRIIGANFSEARRMNLRGISEAMMEPYRYRNQ